MRSSSSERRAVSRASIKSPLKSASVYMIGPRRRGIFRRGDAAGAESRNRRGLFVAPPNEKAAARVPGRGDLFVFINRSARAVRRDAGASLGGGQLGRVDHIMFHLLTRILQSPLLLVSWACIAACFVWVECWVRVLIGRGDDDH